MAEPLPVLASIAGGATAGLAISSALYDMAQRIKRAPKEVSEMAKGLSLLSLILRHLRKAMQDNQEICQDNLIKDIKGLLKRIRKLYQEVKNLTEDGSSSLVELKSYFKSPETKVLMSKIESFKSILNLILATVQLAALQVHNLQ